MRTDYDDKMLKMLERLEKKMNNFDSVLDKFESRYDKSEASRNLKLDNKIRTTAEKIDKTLTNLGLAQNNASRDFISYANSTGKYPSISLALKWHAMFVSVSISLKVDLFVVTASVVVYNITRL